MADKAPEEISFGEWLRQRRRMLDLTQQALANQVGCARITLRRIESGALKPSKELVHLLLDKLGIPETEHPQWILFARSLSGFPAKPGNSFTNKPLTNLPASLTSFIGREKEQAEILKLISKHRLVTLVGPGGVGKTRLSLKVGEQVLEDYDNGVWLVELASLNDSTLLPQKIAVPFGITTQGNTPYTELLNNFLRVKSTLLILDNCEHLLDACAQLTDTLLKNCSKLKILTTSREPLGITGEAIYHVPSLGLPDMQQLIEKFRDYESVLLFEERAQLAKTDFSLTIENASSVAQICHRLDGIPLAIELAAARVNLFSTEQIAEKLNESFNMLAGSSRTVLLRQQTIRASIDWSWGLLTESEQTFIRQLSVFAGGWTLESAHAICEGDALNLISALVKKSLIMVDQESGHETRYRFHETIRQYARQKLWEAGEGEMMRQRHLAYFVDLAERAEPNLRAFDMVLWLDRLETELDNIRTTLNLALESDIEAQLRLASALLWFWHIRGHRNEAIDRLEKWLSIEIQQRGNQPLSPERAMIRGNALNATGILIAIAFESRKAQVYFEESLGLFHGLGSAGKRGMAYALWGLAGLPSAGGQAVNMLERSLALFHEVRDKFGMSECLLSLAGHVLVEDNNYKQAKSLVEEQLALRKEIGDHDGIATALGNLRDLAFEQGDYQRAITLHEESLAIFWKVKNKWAIGYQLSMFEKMFLWQADYEQAAKTYEDSLFFAQDVGDKFLIAFNSYSLGAIVWLRGDYSLATQMITDSLTVFHDAGNDWLAISSLHTLGDIALAQGDYKRAAQWYEAELTLGREEQLKVGLIFALCGLGKIAWAQGDHKLATIRLEQGLSMSRETGFKLATFHALYGLGRVAQSRGNFSTARSFYREALAIAQLRTDHPFHWISPKAYRSAAILYPLEALAGIAKAQNQMERATRLVGALAPVYYRIQFQQSPAERNEHEQIIAVARAEMGEEAFMAAYEEGKKMTLEEAVAYALGET